MPRKHERDARKRDASTGHPLDPKGQAPDVAAEEDRIIQLVHDAGLADPDPADPANAAYFDWLAQELRDRQSPAERAEAEAHADRFVDRMRRRFAAERLVLRTERGGPSSEVVGDGVGLANPAAPARARWAPFVESDVAAGVGREVWDEPVERWVALPDGVPDGRYVAIRVSGDSMEPVLHAGDSVLVRLGPELARGSLVVARKPDDGYVVKQIGAVTEREVELLSFNPAYPPMHIARDTRLVVGTVVLRWCAHHGPGD
jgi:SOS-response transcriptional repressor LexA